MDLIRLISPIIATALVASLAPHAAAQFVPVFQDRGGVTEASLTNGAFHGDSDFANDFGLFTSALTSYLTATDGASSSATSSQTSEFTPTLIHGVLASASVVATGTTNISGHSIASGATIFTFDLLGPERVRFLSSGGLSFVGSNGVPTDLYGFASVWLMDSTGATLASIDLSLFASGTDTDSYRGTLPAGQYSIFAVTKTHAISHNLIGPPPGSGTAHADISFSLAIVPAPGAAALLGLGTLVLSRRRRTH